jgi:hypothetical protein
MKYVREFLSHAFLGGVLVLLPIYLAVLVLLKGMQSVAALVRRWPCCCRTRCPQSSSCLCFSCSSFAFS